MKRMFNQCLLGQLPISIRAKVMYVYLLIMYLVLISVCAYAQSYLKPIEGQPILQYGKTTDDITVIGGTLLANPLVVSDDKTWEKSGDVIVKSLRQISIDFEEGTGVKWGQGSENWVFHIDDNLKKSRGLSEIEPAQAKTFAKLRSNPSGRFLWGMLTLSSVKGWDSEARKAFFTEVVFRKNLKGDLILGVTTSNDAEIHVPPIILSLTPSVVSSLLDAILGTIELDRLHRLESSKASPAYQSSTDIAISQELDGSLLAKGRMEFLLLGWRRLYTNFGGGTKVRIVGVLQSPLKLVDAQNQITAVTSGTFVFSQGKWVKAK